MTHASSTLWLHASARFLMLGPETQHDEGQRRRYLCSRPSPMNPETSVVRRTPARLRTRVAGECRRRIAPEGLQLQTVTRRRREVVGLSRKPGGRTRRCIGAISLRRPCALLLRGCSHPGGRAPRRVRDEARQPHQRTPRVLLREPGGSPSSERRSGTSSNSSRSLRPPSIGRARGTGQRRGRRARNARTDQRPCRGRRHARSVPLALRLRSAVAGPVVAVKQG